MDEIRVYMYALLLREMHLDYLLRDLVSWCTCDAAERSELRSLGHG
jgi:hypothetical protein